MALTPRILRPTLNKHAGQTVERALLVTIGAGIIALLGGLVTAIVWIGDATGVIDGLCRRAPSLHSVPFLCADRMKVDVLCTQPSEASAVNPCISFYVSNPIKGFDILGGGFEIKDVSVGDAGGSPLGINAREATFHAKITDKHLVVGETIPFEIDGELTGSGENISIQVCPFYTSPTRQVTLTVRPMLYSQFNEEIELVDHSIEVRLTIVGSSYTSIKLGPAPKRATLANAPGTPSTFEYQGCQVTRK